MHRFSVLGLLVFTGMRVFSGLLWAVRDSYRLKTNGENTELLSEHPTHCIGLIVHMCVPSSDPAFLDGCGHFQGAHCSPSHNSHGTLPIRADFLQSEEPNSGFKILREKTLICYMKGSPYKSADLFSGLFPTAGRTEPQLLSQLSDITAPGQMEMPFASCTVI